MMKTIITIFFTGLICISASGQQTADYLMKARALSTGGKYDQAVKVLSDALSNSADQRLYLERAEILLAQRSYPEAIADLNEANRISPGSGEYGLARVYALKGDVTTSVYHLGLSMNSGSKHPEKEIMLDPAFNNMDNRPEWRQFWKKEWYSGAEKGISDIEYYVKAGKNEDAGSALEELKTSYPGTDAVKYADALVKISAGKYNDAVSNLTDLLGDSQGNEKYLSLLARAQSMSGNTAGASETYTRLLNTGFPEASLLLQRAECYRKTGENDKAMKDVDQYLELYPDDRTAISLAGRIASMSGDNLKALDYYNRNLKLHPNDPACYMERGNSYFVSKSWDWAIDDYSMSLDLSPSNADVWLNKGIALLNTGKVEDACHDFKKALRLGNKKASEYISGNCIK